MSTIVHDEILPNPALDAIESGFLAEIADNARYIETLSTGPRYGLVIAGNFTPPEDLYDTETIKEYISHLITELTLLISLMDLKDPQDWQVIKDALINAEAMLQPLVD